MKNNVIEITAGVFIKKDEIESISRVGNSHLIISSNRGDFTNYDIPNKVGRNAIFLFRTITTDMALTLTISDSIVISLSNIIQICQKVNSLFLINSNYRTYEFYLNDKSIIDALYTRCLSLKPSLNISN